MITPHKKNRPWLPNYLRAFERTDGGFAIAFDPQLSPHYLRGRKQERHQLERSNVRHL